MASTLLLPPYRHHSALSLLSNTQDPPIIRGLTGPCRVVWGTQPASTLLLKAGTLLLASTLLLPPSG